MDVVISEVNGELGAEEKLIALKILLVIYMHDKRYSDALADIEELLRDSEMQSHREYLLLKWDEVKSALASLSKQRMSPFAEFLFKIFHNLLQ